MNELPMIDAPELDPGCLSFVLVFLTACACFGTWLGGFVTECCR